MSEDQFPCICDLTDVFDPPNPIPRAVEGCPAHWVRYAFQQVALEKGWVAPAEPASPAPPLVEWACDGCGYHNVGGICTHCGDIAPIPPDIRRPA